MRGITADDDLMADRQYVVIDDGRFNFEKEN